MASNRALEGLRKLGVAERAFGPNADKGARLEAAQYLADLGYLDGTLLTRLAESDSVLPEEASAIAEFRSELCETQWASQVGGTPERLEPAEVLILRALLDLEDEQPWLGVPRDGEISLRTRVLHHILRCYGLYGGTTAQPHGPETLRGLVEANSYLGINADALELVVRTLGDSKAVAERFVSAQPYQPLRTRTPAPTNDLEEADLSDVIALPGGFESGHERLRLLNVPRLRTERARVARTLRERSEFDHTGWTSFGLQLLQVRLWVAGYYQGRLDRWVGPVTIRAVREALADEASRTQATREAGFARGLRRAPDGSVVLNPALLLLGLDAYDLGALPSQQALEPATASPAPELGLAARAGTRAEEKETRSWWSRAWSTVVDTAKAVWEAGRRIYYGARRVLKSVVEFFKRGVEVIRSALEGIAQRAISIVRSAIAFAREGIRSLVSALRAFWRWIRGAPTITQLGPRALVSDLRIDMEVLTIAVNRVEDAGFDQHASVFEKLMEDLGGAFRAIGQALGLVVDLLIAGFSWPLLLFGLARQLLPSPGTLVGTALAR